MQQRNTTHSISLSSFARDETYQILIASDIYRTFYVVPDCCLDSAGLAIGLYFKFTSNPDLIRSRACYIHKNPYILFVLDTVRKNAICRNGGKL